jgi:hypothetical protein
MDLVLVSERIGRIMIAKEHDYFIDEGQDNLDHILALKRIISGITDFLKSEGIHQNEFAALTLRLMNYAKELFVDEWVVCSYDEEKETDGDIEELKTEAARTFDYMYKNESAPE